MASRATATRVIMPPPQEYEPIARKAETVNSEADFLIHTDKRLDYGGALESFQRIADLWSIVLGMEVTPEQVCLCMIELKVSRYMHGKQRDSVVDICGYAGLIEMIGQERYGD